MLTYRTGFARSAGEASLAVAHLLEPTLSPDRAQAADYYTRGLAAEGEPLTAYAATRPRVRSDMSPAMGRLLGVVPGKIPSAQDLGRILAGQRTDGTPIPGRQRQRGSVSLADETGLSLVRLPTAAEFDAVLAGHRADDARPIPEGRRVLIRRRLLRLYAINEEGAAPLPAALDHARAGRRGDGSALKVPAFLDAITATKSTITFIDLTFSADKNFSIAWMVARTDAERALLHVAHQRAVSRTMAEVEKIIGYGRSGKAGKGRVERGEIGWVEFDHATARPTVDLPVVGEHGEDFTVRASVKVAGDPNTHTHVIIPSAVLTESGRVVALDLSSLGKGGGRIKYFGCLYQAFIATELRGIGVAVELHAKTGAARVQGVPDRIRAAFSKRTQGGTEAARAFAAQLGVDWDDLPPARRIGLLKDGVQGDFKAPKTDDIGDFEAWTLQMQALNWTAPEFVHLGRIPKPLYQDDRLDIAYRAALPGLDRIFQGQAVADEGVVRVAATEGLIAAGIKDARDVDDVIGRFLARGITQDGEPTTLIARHLRDATGSPTVRYTTERHREREARIIALVRIAADDRSAALSEDVIHEAAARSGLHFKGAHGQAQMRAMIALGTGGRAGYATGSAGSGKSAMLAPLVAAWIGEKRNVWGCAVAWRAAQALTGTGIPADRCVALAALLVQIRSGAMPLDASSVVIVDEIGVVSTRQAMDLLQAREKYNFTLIGVGDARQADAVEAGGVPALLERALGVEAVPTIETSVRQREDEERALADLARGAQFGEALTFLRERGRTQLVAGGHEDVCAAAAALWVERAAIVGEGAVLAMAPTRRDAHDVGVQIRRRLQAAGRIGADAVTIDAIDQGGLTYDLPIAHGDRVRVFSKIYAEGAGAGPLGFNGSVLSVVGVETKGLVLRSDGGRQGRVAWASLRDRDSGRVRLAYGTATTVDTAQGASAENAILVMPGGSRGLDRGRGYVALSRHRAACWVIASDGAERAAILGSRPIGDRRPVSAGDVWAAVAHSLSRDPIREGALDLVERARTVRQDAGDALREGLMRVEDRHAQRRSPTLLPARALIRRLAQRLIPLTRRVVDQAPGLVALAARIAAIRAARESRPVMVTPDGPRVRRKKRRDDPSIGPRG